MAVVGQKNANVISGLRVSLIVFLIGFMASTQPEPACPRGMPPYGGLFLGMEERLFRDYGTLRSKRLPTRVDMLQNAYPHCEALPHRIRLSGW